MKKCIYMYARRGGKICGSRKDDEGDHVEDDDELD